MISTPVAIVMCIGIATATMLASQLSTDRRKIKEKRMEQEHEYRMKRLEYDEKLARDVDLEGGDVTEVDVTDSDVFHMMETEDIHNDWPIQ